MALEQLWKSKLRINRAWKAVVYEDAADSTDRVRVVIPGISTIHLFGPCRWMAGEAPHKYPEKGDSALVIFDDDNEPWIIGWWFAN